MATRVQRAPPRELRRTALLVGEGLAEQVFMNHLKRLYLLRGTRSVAVKNAKGKGGAHVLDFALRQWRQAQFDEVGVLLDTDVQWGEPQRALARRERVQVFESTPCLEALLLQVQRPMELERDAAALKRSFRQQFGGDAHEPGIHERAFNKATLDRASQRLPALAALIGFVRG